MKTLKGYDTVRPTGDRVKESLFNIIAEYITNAKVLDLFSGTGSLGIEALSRGAKKAIFVDKSRESVTIIKENLINTNLVDKGSIIKGEVHNVLKNYFNNPKTKDRFDIIFVDPPYGEGLIKGTLELIVQEELLAESGIILTETDAKEKPYQQIGPLKIASYRIYGNTALTIYKI